ncbi:hypothetical protein LTR86_011178 [Recurvomyces mirabilis]|nr:hypothetical protein LTR86_011178 [Recurvomyces mirabilis]
MAPTDPIVFYDIASKQPLTTFGPNPWKTRLALNFKGLPYKTQWVQMPDISRVREELGIPANRTLPDGTPYHTLPAMNDNALHLDSAHPDTPRLFRPDTHGLTAAFNAYVDGIFTKHVGLSTKMPFDAAVEEEVMAIFAKRAGVEKLDDVQPSEEERKSLLSSFQSGLGELAKAYQHTGGTTDWIWRPNGTDQAQRQRPPAGRKGTEIQLDGDEFVYADFIVGAWLKMMEGSIPDSEWQLVREWHGGIWGRLVDALEPLTVMR